MSCNCVYLQLLVRVFSALKILLLNLRQIVIHEKDIFIHSCISTSSFAAATPMDTRKSASTLLNSADTCTGI
jgi:hypothetical protein